MEKDGKVSLWIGYSPSYKKLDDYLSVKYTSDGDSIDSKFQKDFKVHYFDEDFREAFCNDVKTSSLEELLEGCSYCKSVISGFKELIGNSKLDAEYNAGFLLYNFEYDGVINEIKRWRLYLRYIGTVNYDKNERY